MDPLSLTASIVAVIGAAHTVTRGLSHLKVFKDAPRELSLLLGEVSRIKVVLQVFRDASSNHQENAPEMVQILSMAQEKLIELDCIIQYTLTKAGDKGKVDRWEWSRKRKDIERLRSDFSSIRLDLTAVVSATSFAAIHRVSAVTHQLNFDHQSLRNQLERTLPPYVASASLCEKIEESQSTQAELTRLLTSFQQASLGPATFSSRISSGELEPRFPSPLGTVPRFTSSRAPFRRVVQSTKMSQHNYCPCHTRPNTIVLDYASKFWGSGSIRIQGLPLIGQRCNFRLCKQHSILTISINSILPTWFAQRLISLYFTSSPLYGPELLLRVPRVIPWNSPIFIAVESGNVDGFRSLIAEGQGSPYDVDQCGSSLLAKCFHNNGSTDRLAMALYLLKLGIDPYQANTYGNTAVDDAWSNLLYASPGSFSKNFLPYLKTLSNVDWNEYCEERGFSELHKIVCGISDQDLDAEAHSHPGNINKLDEEGGKTPVWYASHLGNANMVRILLDHAADPNLCDPPPIWAAIRNGNLQCVELLLESGVKIRLPTQHTAGPRQFYDPVEFEERISKDILAIDRLLIQHKVDYNLQSLRGNTALMLCCQPKHFSRSFYMARLDLLLDYGVNTEVRDQDGKTAIHHAIEHSFLSAFEVLVRYGAHLGAKTNDGSTILHLAIISAVNAEMIRALFFMDPFNFDLEATDVHGDTARDLWKQRSSRKLITAHRFPSILQSSPELHTVTPTSESEVTAAFGTLLRRIQESQCVSNEGSYSTQSSIAFVENDKSGNDDPAQHENRIPGAWVE